VALGVASRTWRPSIRRSRIRASAISPWIRGAPQNGFSLLILRIRSRSSIPIPGLPIRPRDF
jgi:hypothetical protein